MRFSYDASRARRVCRFFERCLVHTIGEHAGQPFLLEEWQRDWLSRLFGELRPDGFRRYREAYLELPRKNGKSTLAGGVALYLTGYDDEPGAHVYAAALDREQARIVFDEASRMVEASPALQQRLRVGRHAIVAPDSWSAFKIMSKGPGSKHGLNIHGGVIDELHEHPSRDLYDVISTGTGARRQPLIIIITTAGSSREKICWEKHEYARRILSGEIEDDAFLPLIFGAQDSDDWQSEETWKKANPNLGVTLSLDYLRDQARKARQSPAFENTFRRLHLDQWVSQESRFLPMDRWDACTGEPIDESALVGRACFGGLDLSSRLDLTAWVLVFPEDDGSMLLLPRLFLPDQDLVERSEREQVPYHIWQRQGHLIATSGEVIDYDRIENQIEEDARKFKVKRIGFDPWSAGQMAQRLQAKNFEMVEISQSYSAMNNPMQDLLARITSRTLRHGGHPVLRWNADCLRVKSDALQRVMPAKPDRRKGSSRIDGIVAAAMGLDLANRYVGSGEGNKQSAYEAGGLLVF